MRERVSERGIKTKEKHPFFLIQRFFFIFCPNGILYRHCLDQKKKKTVQVFKLKNKWKVKKKPFDGKSDKQDGRDNECIWVSPQ